MTKLYRCALIGGLALLCVNKADALIQTSVDGVIADVPNYTGSSVFPAELDYRLGLSSESFSADFSQNQILQFNFAPQLGGEFTIQGSGDGYSHSLHLRLTTSEDSFGGTSYSTGLNGTLQFFDLNGDLISNAPEMEFFQLYAGAEHFSLEFDLFHTTEFADFSFASMRITLVTPAITGIEATDFSFQDFEPGNNGSYFRISEYYSSGGLPNPLPELITYEPIPEPSTYAAVFGGLVLGLALFRRRMKKGL